ncbi:MAG: K(+)-stimulated pyrophosphate-energized sodium pump [Parcubacteria group bacterium Gr01-1014_31]|nr:MAG: K(+)-stimulated pyrophosphate-energized sodium pump [Parcubacteria group bacterium Gr01-1014_31]
MLTLVFVVGLAGVAVAYVLSRQVLKADTGTAEMQSVALAIKQGAGAYLKRQNTTIAIIIGILALVIYVLYGARGEMAIGLKTVGAFVAGAVLSALSGYFGMAIAVRANLRTAAGAKVGVNRALQLALRGGAVAGFLVVSLSLLGVAGLFYLFGGLQNPTAVPMQLVGFGFGASLVALFAQLGGGIYTKAADVGADLVGKVEAGIPEDDLRNPAVVADLVGDNVGDCAGRGADLFESSVAESLGAMIIGIAMYEVFGLGGIIFALVAHALGLVASMIGVFTVKVKGDEDPMKSLNRGFLVTAALAFVGFAAAARLLLYTDTAPKAWLLFAACGLLGLLTSLAFLFITQYYTSHRYRPVKSIVEASRTGAATNIITGFAVALENTFAPVVVVGIALLTSHWLGGLTGLDGGGLFGTALATMGMLSTVGYVLAMDTFGPITDNAGGIVEMSNASEDVRNTTDKLDAVGNTTKALTKGYAVGSAALAAFLLFSAYLEAAGLESIDLAKPVVFVGALMGGMLVFLFASLAIRAVGKGAYYIINDVRDQFKENPGIMAGTSKPNYARCVDIATKGALKQMVLPGIVAVAVPTLVGVLLGPEAVGGTLMVGTIAGVLLALVLNNGGGAWDNAKKYVETGVYGGKGSDVHKATVVGDTVGDPFKDTAGPSLHVLIKLLSTLTLVLLPLFTLFR